MSKLSNGQAVACFALVAMILAPTSLILLDKTSQSSPDLQFSEGMNAFNSSNFGAASEHFNRSRHMFLDAGNEAAALESLNWKLRADRVLQEYSLDRHEAEELLADTFPWVPEHERSAWLDAPDIERIHTDGEDRYFVSIAENIAYRNLTLYHEWRDRAGTNPLKTMMVGILDADANRTGTFFNPRNYTADGSLTIERGLLPAAGTLCIWIPAPIETDSQSDVAVVSVSPEAWVRTVSPSDSDIGQIYLEVVLDSLTEDVVVNVSYSFTTYQKHFTIDPDAVGDYDRASHNYTAYTKSSENTLITPEIAAKAREVVGEETNPYLQAKLLYDYVIGNITYSFMPHVSLSSRDIPESVYVHENRFGDCGAQSMYYSALLRSLGVPARACGGYQMFAGGTGSHFWAEFYLPNYGWVPVDVTAADAMDEIALGAATAEEIATYKAYFFGNMDNMRYVIQSDVDAPLNPEPEMPLLIYAAFQNPTASCRASDQDLPVIAIMNWQFVITAED
ncbi:MAG: transglutaminase domain-containing protein [Methanomassiliicoccus sp.]|nr:transglutaminase domain-containing protein [Methanomassiliicoccus sp.]